MGAESQLENDEGMHFLQCAKPAYHVKDLTPEIIKDYFVPPKEILLLLLLLLLLLY